MNKQELREQVLVNLLLNKYRNDAVTALLVKQIEDEFNSINGELNAIEQEPIPKKSVDLNRLAKAAY
jgi:hypothetical protein